MAITAAGVGSGLDIASIVSQLVSAERAPEATRIASARTRFNTQLSALGSLKSALSTLQDKVKVLTADKLSAFKASSSLAETFTATATTGASPGSYDVEVVSLAKAHKLVSDPFAEGSSAILGAGQVEIGVGGESFTVTLTDANSTLDDLRKAINAATDNTGVSATLVNEENGTRLLLSSNRPGTDQQITVNTTLLTTSQKQAAADAHIRVDGYDVYSSSNTVSDAVNGITFTLLKENPGEVGKLTVSRDNAAAKSAIDAFVKAYNSVAGLVASQTKYDAEAQKASTFTGDAAVRGVMQTLRGIVGGQVGDGALSTLAALGITTKTDGTLVLDTSKLDQALNQNPAAVTALVGNGGVGGRLDSAIRQMLGDGGSLDAKTDSLNARLKGLIRQEDALDRRIESVQARYTKQFSALDALIAQMNSTSSYLTQQLDALTKQTR